MAKAKTPKKPVGKTKARAKRGTGSFVCAACNKRRPSKRSNGTPNFLPQENGDPQCLSCADSQDEKLWKNGLITLGLTQKGGKWYAVNRTGTQMYQLEGEGEGLQLIAHPMFHKDGVLWSGKLYLSSKKGGYASFQTKEEPKRGPGRPRKAALENGQAEEEATPKKRTKRRRRRARMAKAV